MSTSSRSKEQRILVTMRKVLAQIVKDTTPQPGMRNPLKDSTIQDIRECFSLISARERELTEQAGVDNRDRPRYADEPKQSKVVSIDNVGKSKSERTSSADDGDDQA